MKRTLLDLAKSLRKKEDDIKKAASDLAAFVALEVTAELVEVTPVDTSKAISNWQIGLGSPVTEEREPYYFGKKGSTELISGEAAIMKARAILKNKKPGEKIYLSNNASYIRDLDEGSSMQEPAGFVKRAADNGRELVRRKKLEIRK